MHEDADFCQAEVHFYGSSKIAHQSICSVLGVSWIRHDVTAGLRSEIRQDIWKEGINFNIDH